MLSIALSLVVNATPAQPGGQRYQDVALKAGCTLQPLKLFPFFFVLCQAPAAKSCELLSQS